MLNVDVTVARSRTHGMKNTPEWRAWTSMRQRVLNSDHPAFHNYGGRGISICEQWSIFERFYDDVGPRPSKAHSLDRYPNNNGNYEPGNVRWATRKEQGRNQRTNHLIPFNGQMVPISVAEESLGFNPGVIIDRLSYGWSVDRALSAPVRQYERKL